MMLILFASTALAMVGKSQGLGRTSPSGTIYKHVNETLEITCTLTDKQYNSSQLVFSNTSKLPVEDKYVKILNDTSIQLTMPNLPSMKDSFKCKVVFENTTIALDINNVYVGTKPLNVIDFKCRSPNWTNMTCTFEKPNNTIESEYTLKMSVFEDLSPTCTSKLYVDNNRKYQTVLGFGANQCKYRQTYNKFYFVLYANNSLGSNEERFTINNFETVIPGLPQRLSTVNVTSNSAVLVWNITRELIKFPLALVHSIKYTTSVFNGEWKELTVIGRNTSYAVTLTNLPFAHTEYDVRVSARVNASEDIAEMWSPNATHLFKTGARIPDHPPKTNIGGFYVDDNNHVTIYWKGLKAYEENGDKAGYTVEVAHGAERTRKPDSTNKIMAQYRSLLANIDSDLVFNVRSTNEKGNSLQHSVVKVPRKAERCGRPEKIKKILATKNNNMRKYMLSWSPPLHADDQITSYTVFWCNTKDESPNKCDMSIDFETLDRHQLSFTYESPEALNFAVSANSKTSSSGMVWALCTALPNNDINKLTAFQSTNVKDTSAGFTWNTQCVDMAILDGYVISYCRISGDPKIDCNDFQNITINSGNRTVDSYRLTGLLPYSTYRVTIAGKSPKGIGPPSDPHRVTTFEAQPTPPRNLHMISVTNTTATLSWDAPERVNGVLIKYEIWYNQSKEVMGKPDASNDSVTYQLPGLTSNKYYDIVVTACSSFFNCSMASNKIHIFTDIGYPSEVSIKESKNMIEWSPPSKPGGALDYYEMRIRITDDHYEYVQLSGTKCTPVSKCEYENIMYWVRAVNVRFTPHRTVKNVTKLLGGHSARFCQEEDHHIQRYFNDMDKHAEHLAGNWALISSNSCSGRPILKIVLFTVVTLLTVLLTAYMVFMMMAKFKKMKDIGVELPEGLRDIIQETKGGNLKLDCSFVPMDNNRSDGLFITRDHKQVMEQEQTLLKKTQRTDSSGGSPNSTKTNSHCEDNEGIDDSESEHIHDDDSSANTITESLDFEKAYPAPLLTVNMKPDPVKIDVKANVYTASPVAIAMPPPPPVIPISAIPSDIFPLSPNNYAPASLLSRPVNINGYVTHDAAMSMARPVNSGYLPWSAVNAVTAPKTIESTPEEVKGKMPIVATTDIQGYVTHKQLSHFGQLIQ